MGFASLLRLPRSPGPALRILILQVGAAALAVGIIVMIERVAGG